MSFVTFSEINKTEFRAAFVYLNKAKRNTSLVAKLFNVTKKTTFQEAIRTNLDQEKDVLQEVKAIKSRFKTTLNLSTKKNSFTSHFSQ